MQDLPLDTTDLSWLAGLARALIGESHAADDLVQDTLVAALEGPLPPEAPRRAWLASVARRLAARRSRGSGRRAARERLVARGEALPDSSALLEKAEIAEQVSAAARGLPEPYRRTILLRFLEGLSPEEIAEREGKPADTVRWRVRRGLELLRAELVQRNGREWTACSLLLLPLARSGGEIGSAAAGVSGVLAGTVATWSAMKLASMAAGLVLGAGLWLAWGGLHEGDGARSQPAAPAPSASGQLARPAADPVGLVSLSEDRQRSEPVAQALQPGEGGALLEPDALRGRVLDEWGRAVEGACAYLVPSVGADRVPPSADGTGPVAETYTLADGAFELELEDVALDVEGRALALDLGVVAEGYLRSSVPDVLGARPEGELVVVLKLGRALSGRVVDESGAGVPGLELLAHTANAGIHHVSPSQSLLRARRAELADASSGYQQARARSDAFGHVSFSGLPIGKLNVLSLDPGWGIVDPPRILPGERTVTWTATRLLGVRLEVVDERSGRPVDRAAATFRVELGFADGGAGDYGQWVGRGRGGASLAMTSEMLPDLGLREVTSALFYGTVRVGTNEVEWRADPRMDADGLRGVVHVRVEIDPGLDPQSGEQVGAEQPGAAPAKATVELDVRDASGARVSTPLSVGWTAQGAGGATRTGRRRVEPSQPGRYRVELDAGEVLLEVSEFDASGSLDPWVGTVLARPDRIGTAQVTLERGGRVTLERPVGWGGEWFVHASWRPAGEEAWRGSWGHSSRSASLTLSALRPARWRFQLRRGSETDPDPLVRIVDVAAGDELSVP